MTDTIALKKRAKRIKIDIETDSPKSPKRELKRKKATSSRLAQPQEKSSSRQERPQEKSTTTDSPKKETSAKKEISQIKIIPVDKDITIYTPDEVASILKVSRRTIYKYIVSRELKAVKLGKDWRVKYEDLREFIQALEYPNAE